MVDPDVTMSDAEDRTDGAEEAADTVGPLPTVGGAQPKKTRSRRKRPSLEERGGFRLVKPVNGHKRAANAFDPAYAERLATIADAPCAGSVAAASTSSAAAGAETTSATADDDPAHEVVLTLQAWLETLQQRLQEEGKDPAPATLQVMPLLHQAGGNWAQRVVIPGRDRGGVPRLWEPTTKVMPYMFAPKISPLAAALNTTGSGWGGVQSMFGSNNNSNCGTLPSSGPGSAAVYRCGSGGSSTLPSYVGGSGAGSAGSATASGGGTGFPAREGTDAATAAAAPPKRLAPWLLPASASTTGGLDGGPEAAQTAAASTPGPEPAAVPNLLPVHGPPVAAQQSTSMWWLWQLRQQAACPCGEPLPPVTDEREGMEYCVSCGLCNAESMTTKLDWTLRETHQMTKTGHVYQRFTHLRDILNKIQCRVNVIPDDMDIVQREIMRDLAAQRIEFVDQVTYELIRDSIRKLGYNQNHYYEYIFLLIKRITGGNMYELPSAMEKAVEVCFDQMQVPFERLVKLPEFKRMCSSDRHNFLNYFYTVFKICHMYGFQWPLRIQSFVKDVDNIILYEKLWKALCQTMAATPLFWGNVIVGTWHFVPYEL